MVLALLCGSSGAKDIIVGTPPWQYKFATDEMLQLPHAVDMSQGQANMRGHALTLDTARGDFYFEYVVKQADLNNATHNVVRCVSHPARAPRDTGRCDWPFECRWRYLKLT